VPVRAGSELRRLLEERLLGRALTGRLVAGPGAADAVRVAAELVAAGFRVALEHVSAHDQDAAAELLSLIGQVHSAGLSGDCELILPVDRLGGAGAQRVGRAAAEAGLGVVLDGPSRDVDGLGSAVTGVVVAAGEADAEDRCRALARDHVRLVPGPSAPGHRADAELAFVRCLNVLMAGEGRPGIAVSDPRLIAIAGERAAWNGRTPDSWELVMPYGVLTHEQRRLVAAGYTVRVTVPSGPAAAAAVVTRRLAGRS
jgi:proline dehydrogenase